MAQRRMIHEKMMSNPDFGSLSPNAKVLYIFCIVLADDDGRLKANAVALRGRVFPFNVEITEKEVRIYLNEIVKKRLVIWYKIENEHFIQHPNWEKYQTLRSDRKKKSDLPPPNDNQMTTKRGRSKLSKEVREGSKESLSYLAKIPEADMQEFLKRFEVGRSKIISKAEDFSLYCKSKGKLYKDYKSALLNAMKKDFPERKINQNSPQNQIVVETRGNIPIPKSIKDDISKIIKNKAY